MLHITLLILLKGCVFRPAFGCANFVYFDQLSNGVIHKYLIRIICLLHFLYRRYLDRVPNFSYFTKGLFSLIMQIKQLLSLLQHPVTILVTDITNPDNLTYEFIIVNFLIISKSLMFSSLIFTVHTSCYWGIIVTLC